MLSTCISISSIGSFPADSVCYHSGSNFLYTNVLNICVKLS